MFNFKFSTALIFLVAAGFLFSSCRTTEEIVEPEPQPEREYVEEEVDHEDLYGEDDTADTEDSDAVEELHTVNFGFDLYSITNTAAIRLAENVETLRENPNVRVRIDAYTDHVGGDQYNLRLSVRRANSVADFYTQNGIAEDRVERRGLGKAPVPCAEAEMDRDTPGCEKNRRAESHPINPPQS